MKFENAVGTLILFRGLPGSGKTTVAEFLYWNDNMAKIYSADYYMTDSDGNYFFRPEKLRWAHETCQDNARQSMIERVPVILVHNGSGTRPLL